MVKRFILGLIIGSFLAALATADTLVFVADWCQYCKSVKKAALELKEEGYDVKIINFDKNKDLAKRYKVTSIPTVIIRSGNSIEARFPGKISKEDLRQLILSYDKKVAPKPFTGTLVFLDNSQELDVNVNSIVKALKSYGCKIIDINNKANSEIVKKYNVTNTPTVVVVRKDKVIVRYTLQ